MPNRRKPGPRRPPPVQLLLFAEAASLVRIRPELREWRYYRMEVWPDLFGRALLVRHWGRIGTEGRRRLDPYPDPGAALNALARLLHAKREPASSRQRRAGPPDCLLGTIQPVASPTSSRMPRGCKTALRAGYSRQRGLTPLSPAR